jgi:hypothetical protein
MRHACQHHTMSRLPVCSPQVAAGGCLQVSQHPLNYEVDDPLWQEGSVHLQWWEWQGSSPKASAALALGGVPGV